MLVVLAFCAVPCNAQVLAQRQASALSAPSIDLHPAPIPIPTPKPIRTSKNTLSGARASSSRIVSLSRSVGRKQSISLSTEYMRVSSYYINFYGYGDKPDWKFKSVPVTVSYEYTLGSGSARFSPYVGGGVSVYLSQMRQLSAEATAENGVRSFDTHRGVGYGSQVVGGVRTRLSRNTFLLTQGRYRLVNGLAVGTSGRDAAQFGLFDVAVGIGVSF